MTEWAELSMTERAERIRDATATVEKIMSHRGASLAREGRAWRHAAAVTGIPYDALRRALDPNHKAQRNERANRARIRDHKAIISRFELGTNRAPHDEAEMRRLKASVPDDMRSITGRLCGDPLPGRSALERRSRV